MPDAIDCTIVPLDGVAGRRFVALLIGCAKTKVVCKRTNQSCLGRSTELTGVSRLGLLLLLFEKGDGDEAMTRSRQ